MRKPNEQRLMNLYQAIRDYIDEFSCSPTFDVMKERFGYVSMATLHNDVQRLKEKGLLSGTGNRIALMRVTGYNDASVVGTVRCGLPGEAVEDIRATVKLPTCLFGETSDLVILEASGDSMTGKGIYSGDWLVVHRQPTAQAGDVVIAILEDGSTTCKVFRKDPTGKAYLQAANPDYPDIIPEQEWMIYGIVRRSIHIVA